MLFGFTVVIISQCIQVWDHYVVILKPMHYMSSMSFKIYFQLTFNREAANQLTKTAAAKRSRVILLILEDTHIFLDLNDKTVQKEKLCYLSTDVS